MNLVISWQWPSSKMEPGENKSTIEVSQTRGLASPAPFTIILFLSTSSLPSQTLVLKQGLKLTKKSSHNFATRYETLVAIFAKFSRKIVALYCVVSGVAKQNKSPQYLCWKKKTAKNGEWYRRNEVVHVTSQRNYAIFRLKENSRRQTK